MSSPTLILRRGILGAFIAACALLAHARTAGSYRDCCFLGYVPPMVSAFLLPAESVDDGFQRASALGFVSRIDAVVGDIGLVRAALDRGYLAWGGSSWGVSPWGQVWHEQPGSPGIYATVSTSSGRPVVEPAPYLACAPVRIPDRPRGSAPGASHPNGALQLTGVLAVVSDLDSTCVAMPGELWPHFRTWRFDFGAPRAAPELGAVCRTGATHDGTTVTVLVPDEQAGGKAAQWLASAGSHWLGFTVSVADLPYTATVLTANGTVYDEITIGGSPCILVEPAGPAGAIVVFHPAGARPFALSRIP